MYLQRAHIKKHNVAGSDCLLKTDARLDTDFLSFDGIGSTHLPMLVSALYRALRIRALG